MAGSKLLNKDNAAPVVAVALLVIFVTANINTLLRIVSAWIGRLKLFLLVRKKSVDEQTEATVTQMFIHPVKSLRAVEVKEATVGVGGFEGPSRFGI